MLINNLLSIIAEKSISGNFWHSYRKREKQQFLLYQLSVVSYDHAYLNLGKIPGLALKLPAMIQTIKIVKHFKFCLNFTKVISSRVQTLHKK